MARERRRSLRLESLEPRLLLSGSVTVAVTDGNLVVTGDPQSNHIQIDQVGLASGWVRVSSGANVTNINGSPSPKLFSNVTGDFRVDIGEGANVVYLHDAAVPRDLRVNSGSDSDVVDMDDVQVIRDTKLSLGAGANVLDAGKAVIGKGLRVVTGDGADVVYLEDVSIAQGTFLSLRGGSNFVNTEVNTRPSNTLGGGLTVLGGGGPDTVDLDGTTVGGKTTLQLGDGTNTTTFEQFIGGRAVNITGGVDDAVTMTDVVLAGSLSAAMGHGSNDFVLEVSSALRNLVSGKLTVRGGNGNDTAVVHRSRINGNASFSLFGGNNMVDMDPVNMVDTDPVTVSGDLVIRTRDGDDAVVLDDLIVGGSVSADLGDGSNAFALVNKITAVNSIGGNVSVRCGAGDDALTVDSSVVGGSATGILGGGTNNATLGDSTVQRHVKIVTGAGDDTVTLDTLNVAGKTTVNLGGGTNNAVVTGGATTASRHSGGLTVRGSGGDDGVSVDTAFVGGAASFLFGHGTNVCSANQTAFLGAFTYRGGDDLDVVTLQDYGIGRDATIGLGNGPGQANLGANVNPLASIAGNLVVTGGSGVDTVQVEDTEIGRNARFALGNGPNNTLALVNNYLVGSLGVGSGSGQEYFLIDTCHIARGVNIISAAGDDVLEAKDSYFGGALVCNSTAGDDVTSVSKSWVVGPLRTDLGSGDDQVTLENECLFHGNVEIRTADGLDGVAIEDPLVAGRLLVDTGSGNDSVDIARAGSQPAVFEGRAIVRTGSGDDLVNIGLPSNGAQSAHFRAPLLLDGGPGASDVLNRGFFSPDSNGNTYYALTEINWEMII